MTKPKTKKKASSTKKISQEKLISEELPTTEAPIEEEVTEDEVKEEKPFIEEEEAMQEEPEIRRYKFIATCNNLNISNVIFNNIRVIIYQINTTSFDVAFKEFQNVVLKMFNGDIPKYNTFMHSVFGDQITVESTPVEYVKEEIATLS